MTPVPDHPTGERFCKKCGVFLPLEKFFGGDDRRYECKMHYALRRQNYKGRRVPRSKPSDNEHGLQKLSGMISKPDPKKAALQIWHTAWADCRSIFGQMTVGMSQPELRRFFESSKCEPHLGIRVVPIDPHKSLTSGNARIVTRDVRQRAVKALMEAKKRCIEGGGGVADARAAYMAVLREDAEAVAAVAREAAEAAVVAAKVAIEAAAAMV